MERDGGRCRVATVDVRDMSSYSMIAGRYNEVGDKPRLHSGIVACRPCQRKQPSESGNLVPGA